MANAKQAFISNKIGKTMKAVSKVVKKPQLSQRDQYANAMNKAQKNGGSNGVGVGY